MKRLTITGLALFWAAMLNAQVESDWGKKMNEERDRFFGEYEKFKQQAYQDYEDFRRQANEEYAKFMEEAWKQFDARPAVEPPAKPKPPVTPEVDADLTPKPNPDGSRLTPESVRMPDPLSVTKIPTVMPDQVDRPQPVEPIVLSAVPMTAAQNVSLYGTMFPIHLHNEALPMMKDASEKNVAQMWRSLATPSFDHIIAECLQQRENRKLCDWAYVRFTQQVAEKQFGKGTNEAVVMQMYLLTQSGYQMRIGRDDANKLLLLMGSKEQLFRYRYFEIEGTKFYILDRSHNTKGLNIYDHAFPKEKSLSLLMTQPVLSVDMTEKRTVASRCYPNLSVAVQTNKNLIEFYNDYPINFNWHYYSLASLSPVIKESLYPALRKAIEGKTPLESANILIDFVQTGFKYATDDQQFGYERPLYPDETFYYPYSDCEDRSILFSCLVRELLGLEVVLLDYPTHIATAIYFGDDADGDYLMLDGKKFIISDPTYINAPVGKCPPKYKTTRPNIIKF